MGDSTHRTDRLQSLLAETLTEMGAIVAFPDNIGGDPDAPLAWTAESGWVRMTFAGCWDIEGRPTVAYEDEPRPDHASPLWMLREPRSDRGGVQ